MTTRTQVLVVDRDHDQLETLRRGLHLLGFECLCAQTASEALARLVSPEGARIELLVVDLSAPAKPEARLVEQARSVRPQLAVLAATGLALSPEVIALAARGMHVLRKPFTPEELGRAIEVALNRNDT